MAYWAAAQRREVDQRIDRALDSLAVAAGGKAAESWLAKLKRARGD